MADAHSACRTHARRAAIVVALAAAFVSVATFASAAVTGMQRASVIGASTEIAGTNAMPSMSADGRYVAFESDATMTISAWAYASGPSIYLRDRDAGTLTLVTSGLGARASGPSHAPVLSADGRYVVFTSRASNLITSTDLITNAGVYRWSVATHTVERVDVVSGASPLAWNGGLAGSPSGDWWYTAVSDDGRYVAYCAPAAQGSSTLQVYVRDMARTDEGAITLASVDQAGRPGARFSTHPAISADGSIVAFVTSSPLASDDTNSIRDVYVRDLAHALTLRASAPAAGAIGPSGSSDWPSLDASGTLVSFVSSASNLVTETLALNLSTHLVPFNAYVRDLGSGATELVSVTSSGSATDDCSRPVLSHDGRYVAFQSKADNLHVVNGVYAYWTLFVRDRSRPAGELSAVASQAVQPNDSGSSIGFTSDARYVVFSSEASNLVSGDTNGKRDVFLFEYKYKATPKLSTPKLSTSYVRKNRSFYISGTVSQHAGAQGVVKLMIYKRRSGSDYYKTVTVYTAVNGTSYRKKLSLPSTGKWYVRAAHVECEFYKAAYSSYRYFTVYR